MVTISPRSSSLAPEAEAILQLLVNFIREGRFLPGDEESFVGYKEAHKHLGLSCKGIHWGGSLRQQGLEDLAKWVRQNGLPAITGLIVDQTTFRPGDGYFGVYGHSTDDRGWWADQVREAIAFDWSLYVVDDPIPTLDESQAFDRAIIEGSLVMVSAAVRSRCETLRRRARQYYRDRDGKLRCEVCGWHKPDNRISGDIVELHHIRPLAELPSGGARLSLGEAIRSLAPLCPCCHRIAHSRIGGKTFTLEELKGIIPKCQTERPHADCETASAAKTPR